MSKAKLALSVSLCIAFMISCPSLCETIDEGIVIVVLVPPITIGVPAKLFTTITATAPAFCAFITLSTKAQAPLSIMAILPEISLPLIRGLHPNVGSLEPSSTIAKLAVITEVVCGPKTAFSALYSPATEPVFMVNVASPLKKVTPVDPPMTCSQVVPPSVERQIPFPLTAPLTYDSPVPKNMF